MASREEIREILDGVELIARLRVGESGYWVAYCEEVPEARTQGETKAEALENLRGAVEFILEDRTTEELHELRTRLAAEQEPLTL